MKVPRHIARIDSTNPETGWFKSAGWQVRYGPRPWRYFPDSKERPKRQAFQGNPRTSLVKAYSHLRSIYKGPRPHLNRVEWYRKRHPTGVVGIRYLELPPGKGNVRQYYVEVTPIKRGDTAKRFYVCTENTFTQEKLERAWNKAFHFRTELIRGVRSVN